MGDALFDYGTPDFADTGDDASGLGGLERAWFVLDLHLHLGSGVPAKVYPALFAAPATAYVKGTMPSVQQGRALSGIFSLASLPNISHPDLELKLGGADADMLTAYDVGQGNSNALLRVQAQRAFPTLYFDLGAGVYRNQHTTPANLVFCFSRKPPILLSHWDADHWAGAYASSVHGTYPALIQEWYAPLQIVGPVHTAFAHDVISAGGSIATYTPAGLIGTSKLVAPRTLRFTLGSGSDRNNTGFVVAVEDDTLQPPRSWILTGDCDYRFFSHLQPQPPVGLVAPHHGADLASGTQAPAPVALPSGYRRLLYSFGAGNRHGSKQHPTSIGMQLHETPGWNHGAWNPAAPGLCLSGGDVLETELHALPPALAGSQLGGCLVAWDKVPAPVKPPCGGASCTTSPVQT